MISLSCPWCEEDSSVELRTLQEPGAVFSCAACGTSVTFVEEAPEALELAA